MVREIINKYFMSSLGEQCEVLYSTSDDRVFIRYEEALKHTRGTLDNTNPLIDKNIIEWDNEY